MLTPLFNRVIIKPNPKKEKVSTAGIIVSSGYDKTEEIIGTIVAVGKDVQTVKADDVVSFPMYGYDTVTDDDGTSYMSVREPEILAVITK